MIINLNPRESECAVCGCALIGCRRGIPFHEGEPVSHDWEGPWVGRDSCTKCFNEYEATQIEPTNWLREWSIKQEQLQRLNHTIQNHEVQYEN